MLTNTITHKTVQRKPYKAMTAMEALSDQTGLPKDKLLTEDRGFIQRHSLKRQVAKKLKVQKRDIDVPRSGPVRLKGKALGKVASHASLSLLEKSGTMIGAAAVVLGGPIGVESRLNGDTVKAAQLSLQETQAALTGETGPTERWAHTSDGWNLA